MSLRCTAASSSSLSVSWSAYPTTDTYYVSLANSSTTEPFALVTAAHDVGSP